MAIRAPDGANKLPGIAKSENVSSLILSTFCISLYSFGLIELKNIPALLFLLSVDVELAGQQSWHLWHHHIHSTLDIVHTTQYIVHSFCVKVDI